MEDARMKLNWSGLARCSALAALATVFCLGAAPAAPALLPAALAGSSALVPLAQAILARHIDPLAFAPIAHPPMDVAAFPPEGGAEAGEHRLDYPQQIARAEPSPRQRPTEAGTQTAEVIPAETKPAKVADTLSAAAQAYQRFKNGVLTIAKLRLDRPENIRQAQRLIASQNQVTLGRGWMAASGEIATKVSAFMAGINKDPTGTKAKLEQSPTAVTQIDGWQAASAAVIKQVASDAALLETVAYRLVDLSNGHEPARSAQAATGQYGTVPPPAAGHENIAEEKKASVTRIAEFNERLQRAKGAAAGEPPAKSKALMMQILALGARMQLADKSAPVDPQAASHADNDQCLRWAQLNLNQCLAAAHDNTERGWCLGTHGIHDRVKCWSWIVDGNS